MNSSSWITTVGLLALEHVDQLRAGEGGVEVEHVGAQLGGGDAGVDEAAVVAAHDRDAVALPDAHGPRATRASALRRSCSSPKVSAPELVDRARPGRASAAPAP